MIWFKVAQDALECSDLNARSAVEKVEINESPRWSTWYSR